MKVSSLFSVVAPALLLSNSATAAPAIATQNDPNAVHIIKAGDLEGHFLGFGATMQRLLFHDKNGKQRDLVLGNDDINRYHTSRDFFDVIVGRYANRLRNGTFTLEGKKYQVPKNEASIYGGDALHGGTVGFDQRNWTVSHSTKSSITFQMVSPDGDMGFPGKLTTQVTYTLTDNNQWHIDYHAVPDKDTVINLSQHTFWNLAANADNSTTVLDHEMWMDADKYIPVDATLIPTGEIKSVKSTPYLDFTKTKTIGRDIKQGTVAPGGGYDNAWIFREGRNKNVPVVRMYSPITGITLEMATDQPSLQFYSGNGLNGTEPRKKSQGGPQGKYEHFGCAVLEAQHVPDTINNEKTFGKYGNTIYKKGQAYTQHTRYQFSVGDKMAIHDTI